MKRALIILALLAGCRDSELIECKTKLNTYKKENIDMFYKSMQFNDVLQDFVKTLCVSDRAAAERIFVRRNMSDACPIFDKYKEKRSMKDICYDIKFYNNKLCGKDECDEPLPKECRQ